VVPWRRDATIGALTREILGIQRRAGKKNADECVAIGQRIARVKARLEHGEWKDWVANAVPFTDRTALNYIAVAAFAKREPAEYRRLQHLGPAKLYVLITQPPQRRRALPLDRALPLPDGTRKTVEVMTATELENHLDDLALPPAPEQPIERVVQTFRSKLGGLEAAAAVVLGRSGEIDEDDARKWHGVLGKVMERFEKAFDL
jgi:hypothetical protein